MRPQRHFIINPPAEGDTRERNAFGVLTGFGKAYAAHYAALDALRQELCDEINATPYGNERGRAKDRAVTAIDNCIAALREVDT